MLPRSLDGVLSTPTQYTPLFGYLVGVDRKLDQTSTEEKRSMSSPEKYCCLKGGDEEMESIRKITKRLSGVNGSLKRK